MLIVRRLSNLGIFPRFNGHSYDLFAALKRPMNVQPSSNERIPLGISVEFPEGTYGRLSLAPHSSLVRIMNTKLDESIDVINGRFLTTIQPGEKVAEFTIENVVKMEIKDVHSN